MTKRDKRIEALRQNPRNVKLEQLEAVLFSLGFVRRSGKGDHRVYTHPALTGSLVLVPRQPSLLPVYVRKALAAIDALPEEDASHDDNG